MAGTEIGKAYILREYAEERISAADMGDRYRKTDFDMRREEHDTGGNGRICL